MLAKVALFVSLFGSSGALRMNIRKKVSTHLTTVSSLQQHSGSAPASGDRPPSVLATGPHLAQELVIHDFQQFTSGMLFGIKTGNKSFSGDYSERSLALQEMVKAQQATWGRNMTREQFIIVGGIHDDGNEGLSSPLICEDAISGLNCKEAVLIDRAIDRAITRKSDWLVVTEDDHYFFLKSFQHHLAAHDPEKPQVFTFGFGCGQTAKGAAPSCAAVNKGGGICAGGSYIMSRGALQMMRAGKSSADFIDEFVSSSVDGQSDLTVSCMFYKRKIPMTLIELSNNIKEVAATTAEEQDKEISTLALDIANFMPTVHFVSSNKSSIPSYMMKVASRT